MLTDLINLAHLAFKTVVRSIPHLGYFRQFAGDHRANVAIIFGIALPALLAAAGAAVDFTNLQTKRSQQQGAADAAALAAAKGLHIVNTDRSTMKAVAETIVAANLKGEMANVIVSARVHSDPTSVEITIKRRIDHYFMQMFSNPHTTVSTSATARVIGATPLCVLSLDPNAFGGITLQENARMTGEKCAVYSNSTNVHGIKSRDSAVLTAELICSAGGSDGSYQNFEPEPLSDCPVLPDPLADRLPPNVSGCLHNNLEITAPYTKLSPGVYCGGLKITNAAKVELAPGTYIIKDGQLTVGDKASMTGEYVGFYFTGVKATFRFDKESTISLTAPKDGTMAGLLMFEDRTVKQNQMYQIFSDDARLLLGTIYLPRGRLYIDATKPIADQSAYTAIISKRVELYDGPHLVLNADYDATDVPVPEGIGTSRSVALTR